MFLQNTKKQKRASNLFDAPFFEGHYLIMSKHENSSFGYYPAH